MDSSRINGFTTIGLIVLSSFALLDVLVFGYGRAPLADEGAAAHMFQLAILAMAPTGLAFLATADWAEPIRVVRRLIVPGVVTALAFAALFYLERVYYPAHFPPPIR